MNRFVWEKGDLLVGRSLCDHCIFRIEGETDKCKQYEVIPEKIRKTLVECPYFDWPGRIHLDRKPDSKQ